MMKQGRRTILKIMAVFLPASVLATYARAGVSSALNPILPSLDPKEVSYVAVRDWLVMHNVDVPALDMVDKKLARSTSDLRESFRRDPLISAGGLLLPTGFCRHCLSLSPES